jgi:hypothetical protein
LSSLTPVLSADMVCRRQAAIGVEGWGASFASIFINNSFICSFFVIGDLYIHILGYCFMMSLFGDEWDTTE